MDHDDIQPDPDFNPTDLTSWALDPARLLFTSGKHAGATVEYVMLKDWRHCKWLAMNRTGSIELAACLLFALSRPGLWVSKRLWEWVEVYAVNQYDGTTAHRGPNGEPWGANGALPPATTKRPTWAEKDELNTRDWSAEEC